jgi:hypothetical protein
LGRPSDGGPEDKVKDAAMVTDALKCCERALLGL